MTALPTPMLTQSEAYSPPRISDAAARMGLKAGFALDLTEFHDNGKTWDLSDPQMQRRVLEKLREEKPWLLVVSSLCTPLSQLQHGNNGLKHTLHLQWCCFWIRPQLVESLLLDMQLRLHYVSEIS